MDIPHYTLVCSALSLSLSHTHTHTLGHNSLHTFMISDLLHHPHTHTHAHVYTHTYTHILADSGRGQLPCVEMN